MESLAKVQQERDTILRNAIKAIEQRDALAAALENIARFCDDGAAAIARAALANINNGAK